MGHPPEWVFFLGCHGEILEKGVKTFVLKFPQLFCGRVADRIKFLFGAWATCYHPASTCLSSLDNKEVDVFRSGRRYTRLRWSGVPSCCCSRTDKNVNKVTVRMIGQELNLNH